MQPDVPDHTLLHFETDSSPFYLYNRSLFYYASRGRVRRNREITQKLQNRFRNLLPFPYIKRKKRRRTAFSLSLSYSSSTQIRRRMVRFSNNLVGILNFITFLLSIPILGGGIWLSTRASTDCEKFLEKPVIALGVFLLVVSLAGLIGACCRVSWLLWVYLLVMFLLIVLLFCFTIFAFVVTNKGAGEVVSERGYKEYKLGDYSNWLQKRVNNNKNWRKIRSCLQDSKVCKSLADDVDETFQTYIKRNLSPIQSGCCKPPTECNLTFMNATVWNAPAAGINSTNPDCKAWTNENLCFDCSSCKAGVLDNLKRDWKKVAVVNIIFLVFLVIVYSIGCCAFRNNRDENHYPRWKGYP